MKKKILIIFLIAIVIFAVNLINKKRNLSLPQEKIQKTKEKAANSNFLFSEAEKYFQKGELLKAKENYEKIIKLYPDNSLFRKAEMKLGDINIKLLFSVFNAENSKIYKVMSGDSLFLIAKKFGTTIDLIKKSNNLESANIYPEQKLRISTAKFSILVDKSDNILTLKADDKVLKKYLVSTGENNSTPQGDFKIVSKLIDPTWYNQGKAFSPRSPDNVLGSRWLGLSIKGYGIHGTTVPETIGRQITDGCVRMLNEDVEELYSIVPFGTKVIIKD